MKRLLPVLVLAGALGVARGQEQELGLLARSNNDDRSRGFELQNKAFDSAAFKASTFKTSSFGVKTATTKEFQAKSFLGIKNPWFGKAVYETPESRYGKKSDPDVGKKYGTDGYAAREYPRAQEPSELKEKYLPENVTAKRAIVEPKAQGGVDKFTQNLSKDLTIDQVRDLLNKGQGR